MKPRIGIIFLTLASVFMVSVFTGQNHNFARAESSCNLPGEHHGDWNPSSKKFYKMVYTASLCEVAICIDKGDCTNHDKVDWNRFLQSPAFTGASSEQKKEMKEYHEDGNGMDGFGGYELQEVVEETN